MYALPGKDVELRVTNFLRLVVFCLSTFLSCNFFFAGFDKFIDRDALS